MYDEWNGKVDFLHVYIREAHAVDHWPLGNRVQFTQHTTQEYRIECAEKCWKELGWKLPSVTDSIGDAFCTEYSAWPERFFIIHNGVMKYVASPQKFEYDPMDITAWVESWKHHLKNVVGSVV